LITYFDVLYSAEPNLGQVDPMANEEHLSILKSGVSAWNKWRSEHPEIVPDLREANLSRASLNGADLHGANLNGADLIEANLIEANLNGADLSEAAMNGADVSVANLNGADLDGTDLDGTDLSAANLRRADLSEANLSDSIMWYTSVADIDLSGVKGLETVRHEGPSSIGIDTIYRSKANIPESFLRGAGVPHDFITYMRSLVGSPIEFYSCFISYSSKDDDFAKRLYADLQREHVRCWFAPEDLKIGDKFRPRIDEAIRIYDKLLLFLSENSIHSPWVEKEIETAFEKEHKSPGKTVLFPIRLDDAVMETDQAWAADIRRTRHIGDFSNWKDHDEYKNAFDRLLRDLNARDKNPPQR
jgi:TIR domain/Pentapeptide repeats (8 copies)